MESIGQILTQAREEKKMTRSQVSGDTHISKEYIQALEEDNFDAFPGETYLLGFLRNYSDFLGVESSDMVQLYKNTRIQEQPVPLEALLQRKKRPWGVFIAIGIILVVVIAAGVFLFPLLDQASPNNVETIQPEAVTEPARDAIQYAVSTARSEERLFPGDTMEIADFRGRAYSIPIDRKGDQLVLHTDEQEVSISLAEIRQMDLNGDGIVDLEFEVLDLIPGNRSTGILVAFQLIASPEDAKPYIEIGRSDDDSRVEETVVLKQSERAESFDIRIVFRSDSFFRYFADGRRRVERYYQQNEQLLIENVNREVFIGTSNAGAVALKVDGEDLVLGSTGKVVTRLIRWRYDDMTRKYLLELIPVY